MSSALKRGAGASSLPIDSMATKDEPQNPAAAI